MGTAQDQEPNQAESNNLYYKAQSSHKLKGMSCIHQPQIQKEKELHGSMSCGKCSVSFLRKQRAEKHGAELTSCRLILAVRLQCLDLQRLSETTIGPGIHAHPCTLNTVAMQGTSLTGDTRVAGCCHVLNLYHCEKFLTLLCSYFLQNETFPSRV